MKLHNQLLFSQRLSLLLESGISLGEALLILEKSEKKSSRRLPYKLLQEDILSGVSLSQSISKRKISLDATLSMLIETGETSGSLGACLKQAFHYLEKKNELKKKVAGSLVYPTFIVCATIGMTLFLILFIFPKIIPLLTSLNITLPFITRAVLAFYHFSLAYGLWTMLGSSIFIITVFFLIRKTKFFRRFFHRTLLSLPILGSLIQIYILSSILSTLHILLASGRSLYDALMFSSRASKNSLYYRAFARSAKDCSEGISLSESLQKSSKLFPSLLVNMILIGEKTGNLSLMCMHTGKFYAEEVESSLKKFSSLIEPLLMILMGLVVGSIALSIILPVYEITNHLNH